MHHLSASSDSCHLPRLPAPVLLSTALKPRCCTGSPWKKRVKCADCILPGTRAPIPGRLPVLPPRLIPGRSVPAALMARQHQVTSAPIVLQDASYQNPPLDPLDQKTGFTPSRFSGTPVCQPGGSLCARSNRRPGLEVKSPWKLENLSNSHSLCHGYQAIG